MNNIFTISKFQEYLRLMRLDKPVGFYLLLSPVFVSYFINKNEIPHHVFIIFLIGTFVMRSLGCVINDIWDQNIDRFVARTQNRPLAANTLSNQEAFKVVGILVTAAFFLTFFLKLSTFFIAVLAFISTVIYPALKRFYKLPQLGLSVAFSFSILMMFNEAGNLFTTKCAIIFLINAIWTFMYDTEYAMADKLWDSKLGIYSSALTANDHDINLVGFLQSLVVTLMTLYGFMYSVNFSYYICMISITLFFIYQVLLIRTRLPELCIVAFKNNQYIGALWAAALIM